MTEKRKPTLHDGRPRCRKRVPGLGGWYQNLCQNPAKQDPDEEGVPQHCGLHSITIQAARRAKYEARYAEARAADNARWDAERARRELVEKVEKLLNTPGELTASDTNRAHLKALVARAKGVKA